MATHSSNLASPLKCTVSGIRQICMWTLALPLAICMIPGKFSKLWISISSVVSKFSWTNRNSESALKTWCLVHEKWGRSEVAKSRPTLWDPVDCSLPHSSIHGIFQARVLEWVTISFSRGSSQPRDQTQVSRIVGRRFTIWATREI